MFRATQPLTSPSWPFSLNTHSHRSLQTLLLVLLQALLLAGCSALPPAATPPPPSSQPDTQQVLIVNHGWHTGFVVATEDIHPLLPFLRERFPHAKRLEFGWGDRAFYQSEKFSSGLALRAILWPTDTVMHVVAVPDDTQRLYSQTPLREVCLNREQLQALLQFLQSSFAQGGAGLQQPLAKGLYGDSAFYPGAGRYHLFNTCNQWTARGLQSAGFDIAPATHLTADSILDFLDERASHRCTSAPSP